MTQKLVSNQKNYITRRSTVIQDTKQPVAARDMWKKQDDDEDNKSDNSAVKKEKKKDRFKTVVTQAKDMEVFETAEVDSDEETDSDIDESFVSAVDVRRDNKKREAADAE